MHLTPLSEATRTLDADEVTAPPTLDTLRALRTIRSAASAAWSLRFRSMAAIATAVAERRDLMARRPEASAADISEAVCSYLRLRPLLFSARDRCLHDSLTLVNFLTAQRIAASWVVGVRIRPFAAHSWIQREDLVLNDTHERVRAFRPILIV